MAAIDGIFLRDGAGVLAYPTPIPSLFHQRERY